MRTGSGLLALACAVAATLIFAAAALGGGGGTSAAGGRHHHGFHRNAFLPPNGRAFHGVSETVEGPRGVRVFQKQVGSHPAVVEDFYPWGTPLSTGALDRWQRERSRGMLSLSTTSADVAEIITPHQIANGRDDHYMIRLNQSIAGSGQVVYIRPLAEMNSFYNVYSGFNSDGSPRPGHAPSWYVRAWRRLAIIVRGGPIRKINHKLTAQGLPRLLRTNGSHATIYSEQNIADGLDHPKVALVWNPQTISNPYIHANRPAAYWPGRRYVDWVAADIYSKFATPGVRTALRRFVRHYSGFPVAIGEYGAWDNDYQGKFTNWLFHFARRHRRLRMLVYYRSTTARNEYSISNYPGARHKLRRILNAHRFMAYAPGLAP